MDKQLCCTKCRGLPRRRKDERVTAYWLLVKGERLMGQTPSASLVTPNLGGQSERLARCEYIHNIPAIAEHPLSPPETGVSTTQWGGGG